MKRYIFNRKPTPKMNKDIEPSKATLTKHSKEHSDIWSMSPTDALKVNYIDSHPAHK